MRAALLSLAVLSLLLAAPAGAAEFPGMLSAALGVTRNGTPIPCLLSPADSNPLSTQPRVLLIGGLDARPESVAAVNTTLESFLKDPSSTATLSLSAVPNARPDASADAPPLLFPPAGEAYHQPATDIAHYLWRWIGMRAPDNVILVAAPGDPSAASLAAALGRAAPCEVGSIPCSVVAPAQVADTLRSSFTSITPSPARLEMRRRLARDAVQVAEELALVYGHQLDSVAYIPALAIVGRMRLEELTRKPGALRDAARICDPFRSGLNPSLPPGTNGSTLSGHLVFAELARRTGDPAWTALTQKAADYGFDEQGRPRPSMPFHSEMSDSVFMGCAILAETGALTGDAKYFAQCLRHLRFMENLCLRPDGLYRHSPLDESAWGRGNGFPALGLSLSLSSLPPDSAEHAAFLQSFRRHLSALRPHQDPTGAWHQIIDHPESYGEFTSTCMITFAIVRGLRRGWLDPVEWRPVVDKAWSAIKGRIGPGGRLVDVCTGTGKMKSLRDYLDRTAILGRDDRGGAMALMVATEIAFWQRELPDR